MLDGKLKLSNKPIKVIGGGLAGAEVALILANNGFDVHIFDNEVNHTQSQFNYYDEYQNFMTENMKYELECLNSPILSLAKRHNFSDFGFVYDREFLQLVKQELQRNIKIQYIKADIEQINQTEVNVIATGHHTSRKILNELENFIGKMHLCFYQPQQIVLDAKSVNLKKLNFETESECFVNLTEDEYKKVYQKICDIDQQYQVPAEFEGEKQITVESLASKGENALRNSVFRPHFCENEQVYASLKMRYIPVKKVLILDNFISCFDEEEQKEILKQIDVLKKCKMLRCSKVERKTFLLSPSCLKENMEVAENIFVCGGFAGTGGSFESLLMANYCAYSIIKKLQNKCGVELLKENTCICKILNNLLEKSVINFRLFNLKYDIINQEDLEKYKREIEVQKFLSKSQIEKFKEKFYGKYF